MILILVDQSGPDQTTVDQGTRGPATVMAEILILVDQTRGDQGTRGPGDQGTRGPAMAEILILVDQTRGDQRDRRWLR